MGVTRREIVRTGTVLAVAAGVAGGATATSDGTDRRPSGAGVRPRDRQASGYGDWVPDPSRGGDSDPVQAVYAAATGAVTAGVTGTATPGVGRDEVRSDPAVANPVVAGGVVASSWLGLGELGLGAPVLGPALTDGSADPAAVPTDRTAVVGRETQVYLGSYETAALRDAVASGPFSEAGDGTYRHDAAGTAVTWTDGAVVVGPDPDRVDAVAGTGAGEVDGHREADDGYAWLLETAGAGDFAVVAAGVDGPIRAGGGGSDGGEDYSAFDGAEGFAQSVSLADGAVARATAAAVYRSAEGVADDPLAPLGTTADDRSVTRDGPRVAVDATYAVADDDGTATVSTPAPTATDAPETDSPETDPRATDAPTDTLDDGGNGSGDGGGPASQTATSGSGPGAGALGALGSVVGAGYVLGRRSGEGSR
ncbi:hypothetical protein [Halosimplex marinum]|uniref:hypothetical protein n=1 Tax=Halosimplex marinum TaxID=3396620 RepID=UPI003F55763E